MTYASMWHQNFIHRHLTQNDKMLFDNEIKICMNGFLTFWCIEFVVENIFKTLGESSGEYDLFLSFNYFTSISDQLVYVFKECDDGCPTR